MKLGTFLQVGVGLGMVSTGLGVYKIYDSAKNLIKNRKEVKKEECSSEKEYLAQVKAKERIKARSWQEIEDSAVIFSLGTIIMASNFVIFDVLSDDCD